MECDVRPACAQFSRQTPAHANIAKVIDDLAKNIPVQAWSVWGLLQACVFGAESRGRQAGDGSAGRAKDGGVRISCSYWWLSMKLPAKLYAVSASSYLF